jgi:hypothetical protein
MGGYAGFTLTLIAASRDQWMRLPSECRCTPTYPSTPCLNIRYSYLQLQDSGWRIYVEVEKVGCNLPGKTCPKEVPSERVFLHKAAFAHNRA